MADYCFTSCCQIRINRMESKTINYFTWKDSISLKLLVVQYPTIENQAVSIKTSAITQLNSSKSHFDNKQTTIIKHKLDNKCKVLIMETNLPKIIFDSIEIKMAIIIY